MFRVMRSFAGGAPQQTNSNALIPETGALDIGAEDKVAATAHVREAPAVTPDMHEASPEIADVRRHRNVPKRLRTAKKSSLVKVRSVSKRAAAASKISRSKYADPHANPGKELLATRYRRTWHRKISAATDVIGPT